MSLYKTPVRVNGSVLVGRVARGELFLRLGAELFELLCSGDKIAGASGKLGEGAVPGITGTAHSLVDAVHIVKEATQFIEHLAGFVGYGEGVAVLLVVAPHLLYELHYRHKVGRRYDEHMAVAGGLPELGVEIHEE